MHATCSAREIHRLLVSAGPNAVLISCDGTADQSLPQSLCARKLRLWLWFSSGLCAKNKGLCSLQLHQKRWTAERVVTLLPTKSWTNEGWGQEEVRLGRLYQAHQGENEEGVGSASWSVWTWWNFWPCHAWGAIEWWSCPFFFKGSRNWRLIKCFCREQTFAHCCQKKGRNTHRLGPQCLEVLQHLGRARVSSEK